MGMSRLASVMSVPTPGGGAPQVHDMANPARQANVPMHRVIRKENLR